MFVVSFFAFLSVIAVQGQSTNSRGVKYPTTRFAAWETLERKIQDQATSMGYDATQWNSPGSFTLEYNRYELLLDTNQKAVEKMDIDSDAWDCYVNHYRGYTWSEMEAQGITSYYAVLGYDETRWQAQTGFVAQIDPRLWSALSPDEKAAAGELCYFEELWNGVAIESWGQTLATTISPSMAATTKSPTQLPTFVASSAPVVAVSSSPVATSSSPPTAVATASPTPIPVIAAFPTDIEPVDSIRYVPWVALSDEFQALAMSLGYDMQTWDLPGSTQIETRNFALLTDAEKGTVRTMGLTQEQWNCYINHYQGFAWDELPRETTREIETLGWDSALWENGVAFPATRDRSWDDLGSSGREAATALCFRYETWELINLEEWYASSSPSATPNEAMSIAPSVLLGEPGSIVPTASKSPTMVPTAASSAVPTSPQVDGVRLATMIISWEGVGEPIESNAFERSIVDYLLAFLVVASPSPISSVDASVAIVDDRSATVTGKAKFEDKSSKVTQQDLEDLLIDHFSSVGTEALHQFLLSSGFDIEDHYALKWAGTTHHVHYLSSPMKMMVTIFPGDWFYWVLFCY